MRDRQEVLVDLIRFKGSLRALQEELSKYPWDADEPLVVMKNTDLIAILWRFVNREADLSELDEWTNAVECREDLGFKSPELEAIITELANPLLYGNLMWDRLLEMIDTLQVSQATD